MESNQNLPTSSFTKLIESMRDAFVIVNMAGAILDFNNEYLAMLGYRPDEMASLTYKQVTPEKWHAYEDEIVRTQVLIHGYSNVYEKEYQRKDGTIFPVELRTILVRDEQGQPEAMWAIIRDISERKRAEHMLSESVEMNRAILNASTASIFLIDRDLQVLNANQMAARRFNVSVGELIGKNMLDLLPSQVSSDRRKVVERAFSTGELVSYEDMRDGIWYESRIHPIFDESGNVIQVAVIADDVTERKKALLDLQASEERYRGLAEAAQDYIFIIDKNDTILYVNNFAAQFFHLPADQVIGRKRADFFRGAHSNRQYRNIQHVIKTGEPSLHEDIAYSPGRKFWLNTSLVPLKNASGEYFAVLGLARDITQRKATERALIQARNQLEDRVARRTAELEAAKEQLRSLADRIMTAQEEERQRVSRELHDDASQMLVSLRYKLAAIQENECMEKYPAIFERMENAIKLVGEITDHLRDLAHSLRPPGLDVGGLHISLKEFCREFSKDTKIEVDYRGENIPGLSQEISINLYRFVQEALANVSKHSKARRVRVRLAYKERSILLQVTDNGQGFTRTGSSNGIGLLGIEERINHLGGSLQIRSRTGKGSTLTARIPFRARVLAGE